MQLWSRLQIGACVAFLTIGIQFERRKNERTGQIHAEYEDYAVVCWSVWSSRGRGVYRGGAGAKNSGKKMLFLLIYQLRGKNFPARFARYLGEGLGLFRLAHYGVGRKTKFCLSGKNFPARFARVNSLFLSLVLF